MVSMLSQLVRFFEDDGWPFEQISDLPALRTSFSGENGKWTCYAHAREEVHQFVFYSLLPVNTPSEKLDAMAEFMTRANYGMIVGNFELNYEDGEVRYKTSIDIGDGDLSLLLVKQLVYPNVATMDLYLPGLMAVIYSNTSATDAITKVEGRSPD
ncbi:MAG: YbjN domain-containing protein [Chloroflexota bacterium]